MTIDATTTGIGAVAPAPGRMRVPFSRRTITPDTTRSVLTTLQSGQLTGGGARTRECHDHLRRLIPRGRAFLTGSCTAALEMTALLLRLQPGDEVIMPSWTFSSTANAFALRGAVPVFVDIRPDTLNIDAARVAAALTPRTRAVCCVHYAGVACDMAALQDLCRAHDLALIEDAAQAYGSTWHGRPLGGIGDLGTFSFHGTKNLSSGEGGALIVNRPDLVNRAEIAWEKGTNRLRFLRGETPEYEWQDLGSSFLPSELTAALLASELAQSPEHAAARLRAWGRYALLLRDAALADLLILPAPTADATHNGHIFAVRFRTAACRAPVMAHMLAAGIDVRTHYRPLHDSPAGARYGRMVGTMAVTDATAASLMRLPIDSVITEGEQHLVVDTLVEALQAACEGVA